MPGNTVKINESKELEWPVADRNIDQVIELLHRRGFKNKSQPSEDEEKVIPLDKERTKMEMLDSWIRDLAFPGKPENFIQEVSGQGKPGEVHRIFCFYTNEHKYTIKAVERSDSNRRSYLGCGVSTRKSRAGEDWTRGNDLPDGDFTKEKWDQILNAIVCYELIKLSKYQKPDGIPEDTA